MVGTWAGTPLFAQGLLASLIRLIVVLDFCSGLAALRRLWGI